jgi:hypothetical protein
MILTEVFVVICATTGAPCMNYVDVMPNVLSISACEQAIQDIARNHTAANMVFHRERSSCTLMPVNTQNDLAS